MHTSARTLAPNARVTSCEVAANLRALSIRLDKDGKNIALPRDLAARIDQIVALFLEKRWNHPRRFDRIQPMSYVLFQAPDDDPTFADDIENIRQSLERFLFGQADGEGTQIASVIGDTSDVTDIAHVSDDEFRKQAPAVAARAAAAQPAPQQRAAPAPSTPSPAPKTPSAAPNGQDAEDDIVIADAAPTITADAKAPRIAWNERIRMRAVYDAPNTAVVAYWAAMIRQTQAREPMAYNDFVAAHKEERNALEVAALEFVVPRIAAQLKSGSTAHCVVPMSYRTFVDRRLRQSYLQMSANIPKDIRKFIIIGVCGGPEGPSSSVLVEAAGAMRQYYRILNWETASPQLDMAPLRDAKFSSVTFVPPLNEPAHSIALARAGDLAKRAAANGLRLGVTNINTQADLAAALRAGVHIHTGAYISDDIEQISPRVGIKPSQLPLKA